MTNEHTINYPEETCSHCGWRCPKPVELHHAEGECLTQQAAGRCVGLVVLIKTPAGRPLLVRISEVGLNPATGGSDAGRRTRRHHLDHTAKPGRRQR